jgi:site-specific recombinase XerD
MTRRVYPDIDELLDWQIQNLATVLRPGTIVLYRYAARSFLSYLKVHHPAIRRLSQLRRNPHILGWLRSLYEQQPSLANKTRMERIIDLRRLLRDLATSSDRLREDLFAPGDYPPRDQYLPRPLSPEDDRRLQQRLRERATLRSKGLLLLRATGMRIGECLQLTVDSLRELGRNQWAIRVPLGKLHAERWIPIHHDTRRIFNDILLLRSCPAPTRKAEPSAWLLQENGRPVHYLSMRKELILAAREAKCSVQPTPHQLRYVLSFVMS